MEYPVPNDFIDQCVEGQANSWPENLDMLDLHSAMECFDNEDYNFICRAFGLGIEEHTTRDLCKVYGQSPPVIERRLKLLLSDLRFLMETPDKTALAKMRFMRMLGDDDNA